MRAGWEWCTRAHDEKLGRDLAIKVLAPGALHDDAARKRFRNEARVLSRLHGERNALVVAVPLDGGESVTVCDTCSFGFGVTRFSVPLVSWSPDGKAMYVSLRAFPFGSGKTAVIPVKAGAAPLSFTQGFAGEADFAKLPGARLINETDVSPGLSPSYFVNIRRSAKANLFRIYLGE